MLFSSFRLCFLLAFLFLLPLSHSLLLPHSLIVSPQSEQLRVCSTLNNFALVQHNNLIRVGYGRKAMAIEENWLASEVETEDWQILSGFDTYAMVIVVRPAVTRSKASWISLSVCESSEAVASSRRRMRESLRIARAIAIFGMGQWHVALRLGHSGKAKEIGEGE